MDYHAHLERMSKLGAPANELRINGAVTNRRTFHAVDSALFVINDYAAIERELTKEVDAD